MKASVECNTADAYWTLRNPDVCLKSLVFTDWHALHRKVQHMLEMGLHPVPDQSRRSGAVLVCDPRPSVGPLIYALLTRGEAYVEQGVVQFEEAHRPPSAQPHVQCQSA